MANADRPMGLQVYGPLLRVQEYTLSSAYSTAIYRGDPVIQNGTSTDVVIATAGTGNPLRGVVVGVFDVNHVPLAYWPASNPGIGYVLVADHPAQLFVVQDNAGTGAQTFGANGSGGNVNLASGTGSTVTGISGWELAGGDTPGNTAADQVRLIKAVPRVDNAVASVWCDWIVQINNHQGSVGIVGVGV